MEIFIILFIIGIPLLWITIFELQKRNFDFKRINFKRIVFSFFENILNKFSKSIGKRKKKYDDWSYEEGMRKAKQNTTRKTSPPPSPYKKDDNEISFLLEKMKNDFLDYPFIDKFYVDGNNITYIFENKNKLTILNKTISEISYYNHKDDFKYNILITNSQSVNVLKLYEYLSKNARKRPMTTYNGVTFNKETIDNLKKQYDSWSSNENKQKTDDEISFDNLSTLYDVKKTQLESLPENDLEYSLRKKELKMIQNQLDI
jgi:hypothetical protein